MFQVRATISDSASAAIFDASRTGSDANLELGIRTCEMARQSLLAEITRLGKMREIIALKLQGKTKEAAQVVLVERQNVAILKRWAAQNIPTPTAKAADARNETATVQ